MEKQQRKDIKLNDDGIKEKMSKIKLDYSYCYYY